VWELNSKACQDHDDSVSPLLSTFIRRGRAQTGWLAGAGLDLPERMCKKPFDKRESHSSRSSKVPDSKDDGPCDRDRYDGKSRYLVPSIYGNMIDSYCFCTREVVRYGIPKNTCMKIHIFRVSTTVCVGSVYVHPRSVGIIDQYD